MKTAPASGPPAKIVVMLLHKDPLLRMGVLAALRGDMRFEVRVGREWEGAGAQALSGLLFEVDVVIADYDSGLAVAADTAGARSRRRVLVVTQRDRESEIRQALAEGVLGYVLIGCQLEEIVDGVIAVHRGQRHLGHLAAQCVAANYMNQTLTCREEDVLRLIAVGWSNKIIASELDIALGTVKSHVKAILAKLEATTRTEAAAVALRRGLVGHDDIAYRSDPVARRSVRRPDASARLPE